MTDKIDDGGPAFPVMPPQSHGEWRGSAPGYPYPESGMSLRDWFAGKALLATAGYRESADIPDIANVADGTSENFRPLTTSAILPKLSPA